MTQPTIEDIRTEARAFLDSHLERRVERTTTWGEGSDDVALFWEVSPEEERAHVEAAQDWRRTKFDAGFGWLHGPTDLGGRGLSFAHHRAYEELELEYELPGHSPFGISLGMIAPTILAHGTREAQERYLRKMWRGDLISCQLFSEPEAGSDLAGVKGRAERDGDEWILNGQKVWTSNAQYSHLGEVVLRSNADAPKHKALSVFIVEMDAPGVEVRPLRQMTGGSTFNEVFLTDVRVPAHNLLGDVDNGWPVALTTLMNERAAIGGGGAIDLVSMDRLIQTARHFGADRDPVLRDELVRLHMALTVADLTNQRAVARVRAGQLPGPEMSIGKLALTQNLTAISAWVSRVLGARLLADDGTWGSFAWAQYVCGTPGMRIAGGSDEIMRNIIGERVLGLPKDPSPA